MAVNEVPRTDENALSAAAFGLRLRHPSFERSDLSSESGQSILEFLLMLPMMIGLVVILVKVNTAIQISINNQQYARAHALWMAFNSPVYPAIRSREINLTSKNYNQMVIGVSENPATEGDYLPKAATHYIARKQGQPEGSAKEEPRERALVRIRDTVTLCTAPTVVNSGGGLVPILELDGALRPKGAYNLGEGSRFDYCSSPMNYVTASEGSES